MNRPSLRMARVLILLAALCLMLSSRQTFAQEKTPQPSTKADEVVRIDTDLVQTDVMVFDRQGRFVDGLKAEQFELRVDGRLVPITFFEQVMAGSLAERARLKNLTRTNSAGVAQLAKAGEVSVRGRTVIFFIDDLHLSLDSLGRTRAAISHFIEREMGLDDWVAIASASGQIGFLQQLTNNKAVLRAALLRLNHVPYNVIDTEHPTMSEYMALKIEQRDRDALGYYVGRCLKENPVYTPAKCMEVVMDRARRILQQASAITSNTLYSLESLMRTSAQLTGRKLVMLISDGFFLGARNRYANVFDTLPRILDEARRHGVVIYTIDARGLFSGQADATVTLVDGNALLDRANVGEAQASQDALNAIAADTGGRALRNSNSIKDWVTETLQETANYYLLAWRPETVEQRANKFKRISASIVDHPEWTVRLPRGYLDSINSSTAQATPNASPKSLNESSPATKSQETMAAVSLKNALGAPSPQDALPTLLYATYLDTPTNGVVLTVSTEVASDVLSYGADGKQAARVDLAGVILNTDGKAADSFQTRINVAPLASGQTNETGASVIYNYRARLKPGLYQVRVAARDAGSGQAGSNMQWIEIPDIKSRALALSSLLVGTGEVSNTQKVAEIVGTPNSQVQFSVSRRFPRNSRLEFLLFIYNAASYTVNRSGARVDLTAQVEVLNRTGHTVINSGLRTVSEGEAQDPARIPFGQAFPLNALAPGRYVLRISVTDGLAKTSATQQINFTVE
jgi:VWFA-related protein